MSAKVQITRSLPWERGAAECKYQHVYDALAKKGNGRWHIFEFDTVTAAERAREALAKYAKRRDWVVETSRKHYRLGARRVV